MSLLEDLVQRLLALEEREPVWTPPLPGDPGPPGKDGKDADPEAVAKALEPRLEALVAAIPVPSDGKDGKDGLDADPAPILAECLQTLDEELAAAIATIRVPVDGKDGTRGPRGPKGDKGDIGPMPAHRWDGTVLQFEQAPGGEWGERVDLEGKRGPRGPAGGGGGGGSSSTTTTFNSWFPGGW